MSWGILDVMPTTKEAQLHSVDHTGGNMFVCSADKRDFVRCNKIKKNVGLCWEVKTT